MEKAAEYLQAAQIRPVGEGALMVSFGSTIDPEILRCARAMVTELEQHPFPGLLEFEASYTGVTVFYDPLVLARESSLPEDQWLSKGYREAAARAGVSPEECLMVGNDIEEDMVACEKAGMRGFLLTDCLINKDGKDISAYPQGSFEQLMDYVKKESAE